VVFSAWTIAAAFSTYFCMYAFRKPFSAGLYDGQELWGYGLKSLLVVSQIAGYMLSKFIGIKVISEMRAEFRGFAILGLIGVAELALVGFAYVPVPLKPVMLFLNGLPLGMIFGLVLSYLEGRQQTEALSAALCASFIISSGVVKSVGRWLVDVQGFTEFQMPMLVGIIFFLPLLVSVWLLQHTPEPDEQDREHRSERPAMNGSMRRTFFADYRWGLSLLIFVYVALTVARTVRDDFAVDIWRDMGITERPAIFAKSELAVAFFVVGLTGLGILIKDNLRAIQWTFAGMAVAFGLVLAAVVLYAGTLISPFVFMVVCGIGLYIPYVAFHTTVFERLIAASRKPCNLGFLMYLADAMGYLGYTFVLLVGPTLQGPGRALATFQWTMLLAAMSSLVALLLALRYFQQTLLDKAMKRENVPAVPITADEVAVLE
ncbi:MAG: hypothetical protein KDA80_19325, partial [Planctomycetaceae bacterium]|nr:hypothetical protein [Planctomycetaceae bacterium]